MMTANLFAVKSNTLNRLFRVFDLISNMFRVFDMTANKFVYALIAELLSTLQAADTSQTLANDDCNVKYEHIYV